MTDRAFRHNTCATCLKHNAKDGDPNTVGLCLLPPENIVMPRMQNIVDKVTFKSQTIMVPQLECHYRQTKNSTPACCMWEPTETIQ